MAKTNMNKTPDSAVEIIDLEGAYPEVTMGLANACGEPSPDELKSWYEDIDRKVKIAHALGLMWFTKRRIDEHRYVGMSIEERKTENVRNSVEGAFKEYEDNLLRAKTALETVMATKGIDFKIL